MMRNALLCCLLLFAVSALGDVRQLVSEGIALYDAGKLDEALAKFSAALAEEPANALAAYELGLTQFAKGDAKACIAHMEPWAKKKNEHQAAMYAVLGNCHDVGGDPKRAVDAYRRGLKIKGDDPQLLYNLSVTLVRQGKHDEARKHLKKELALLPNHASGHYLLGRVFDEQQFRVPAILEYVRFLALAPADGRAKDVAGRLLQLAGGNVEKKSDGNVNITVSATTRKEEGEWAAREMMVALMGAARFLPPDEKDPPAAPLTEFEQAKTQLGLVLTVMAEGDVRGKDHTSLRNLPFLKTLAEKKQLDTFTGIALVSLGLPGTEAWVEANRGAVEEWMKR